MNSNIDDESLVQSTWNDLIDWKQVYLNPTNEGHMERYY